MFLLLLLIPLVSLASISSSPSQVLHVLNENSTLDKDANGVIDCQQGLNEWFALYHDTSNVLRIKTTISYVTEDHAQAIHWDLFSVGYDTSVRWGNNVDVSLAGGNEYILDELCEWYEADSAKRWGNVIYVVFWTDFPIKLRSNDKVPGLPFNAPEIDTCIYKSMCFATLFHLRPGCDATEADLTSEYIDQRWFNTTMYNRLSTLGEASFVPGVDAFAISGGASSLTAWVLPTFIDGDSIGHIISALRKSVSSSIINGASKPHNWAVIEQAGTELSESYAPMSLNATFNTNFRRIYDNRVLCDADCVVTYTHLDTVFLGWTGWPSLKSGDSCSFFFNTASLAASRPDSSEFAFRQITFPIANAAIAFSFESYFNYSHAGSIRPTSVQYQCLGSDALRAGFTYILGCAHEPTVSGVNNSPQLSIAMTTPNVNFAVMAWSSVYMLSEYDPIGNPIGIINKSERQTNEWDYFAKWSKW